MVLVSVYLSICNFSYFLTNKQKTKKVREISYIFCALDIRVSTNSKKLEHHTRHEAWFEDIRQLL